jgi:hypothetical protein
MELQYRPRRTAIHTKVKGSLQVPTMYRNEPDTFLDEKSVNHYHFRVILTRLASLVLTSAHLMAIALQQPLIM